MSQLEPNNAAGLYARLAVIGAMTALAAVAGLWAGDKSVHFDDQDRPNRETSSTTPAVQPEPAAPVEPAPVFFYAQMASGSGQGVVAGEVGMASANGIHQYVVGVPLPWHGETDPFLAPINLVRQADPQARMFLYLKLDPPPAWLAANPTEAVRNPGNDLSSASLASEIWRRDAHTAIEALISAVRTALPPEAVLGYVIGCMDGGTWCSPEGRDTSPANTAGFRVWLRARYKEDAALQQAWKDAQVRIDSAAIPERAEPTEPPQVFVELHAMQRQVDFLAYTSEITAATIALFADNIKHSAGDATPVLARYGYSYEMTEGGSGHFALGRLLDGAVDGFVSPVSYADRGLGGTGAMMGPVDSVTARGKKWFLIDDTRTGIARDPASGEITRPKNIRFEDIYGVQERNFAAALTHDLGLLWADPEGGGWLHDPEMWRRFSKMAKVYQTLQGRPSQDPAQEPYPNRPILAIVVDESSRFYQQNEKKLNEVLLNQVRNCAVRVGVPTRFWLLEDVLSQKVPGASVYLFLNAFKLSANDRTRLHAILQQNKAAAVWMYAPGYIDQEASVEHITATTRIKTRRFDGPEQTGSTCLLPGRWIARDEEFGPALQFQPVFYIDDPEADGIAKYRASGRTSVAVRFFAEGWSSIYCAEPSITTPILREILSLLELHLFFQVTRPKFCDTTYFGPDLVAIHAKETGERVVDLDRTCDVQDLLAPEIGWLRKRTFNVPLKTGETRLLKLTPSETPEAQ